jgi:hypothetical protein
MTAGNRNRIEVDVHLGDGAGLTGEGSGFASGHSLTIGMKVHRQNALKPFKIKGN